MSNGNKGGFRFSRPGDVPAGPRYGNIANNQQAVARRFKEQKLREIPGSWFPHPVEPVIGRDQGGTR